MLVASDFDGTLSQLVERPADAVMVPEAREALAALAALAPRVRVALISGRSAADLAARTRLDPERFLLVGNHGLEFLGCGMDWVHPGAGMARAALEALAERLRHDTRGMLGVKMEDKGYSLSLHYRRLPEARHAELAAALRDLELPGTLRRHDGKRVVEFRPALAWHKGSALRAILKAMAVADHAAVFLGDDVTDEDAFDVIRERGVTLHVGGAEVASKARLGARDPRDAAAFLRALAGWLGASRSLPT